jgi:hypothetical protein
MFKYSATNTKGAEKGQEESDMIIAIIVTNRTPSFCAYAQLFPFLVRLSIILSEEEVPSATTHTWLPRLTEIRRSNVYCSLTCSLSGRSREDPPTANT